MNIIIDALWKLAQHKDPNLDKVCNRPAVLEIAHKNKSVHVTLVHRALRRQIIPVCLDTENLSVSINKTCLLYTSDAADES